MESSNESSDEVFWKNKIKEYFKTFIVIIVAGVVAIIGAVLVFFWFMYTSPIGGQGTWLIGQWTLMHIVCFFILLILWELLFVGLPVALFFGVGGYIWWSRLPEEKKKEFRDREKKKTHRARDAGGSGGGGAFLFIVYCIYMAVLGYYDVPFGTYRYSFWIEHWFYMIAWILIVLGIPACLILLIVYLTVWRKRKK
ncbi:MAG: hypothetical protein ACFE9C_00530 [Candidatus Hodarchaeota archaeon]